MDYYTLYTWYLTNYNIHGLYRFVWQWQQLVTWCALYYCKFLKSCTMMLQCALQYLYIHAAQEYDYFEFEVCMHPLFAPPTYPKLAIEAVSSIESWWFCCKNYRITCVLHILTYYLIQNSQSYSILNFFTYSLYQDMIFAVNINFTKSS